jgi:hypothetical protein
MKKNDTDRLLYFQIALSAVLALTLLIINYEKPKPKYESKRTLISGLQIRAVDTASDTAKTPQPPERKKMKKN